MSSSWRLANRPPSPRLLRVSTAFQRQLAGEAGRTSETRSTGTSALPSLGGHQISPDLGTPVARRPPGHLGPVHSRLAVLLSEHVLTLVVSSQSVRGHVTRVPVVPARYAVARVCRPHRLCARVRADAPWVCPGRLPCSSACQDPCNELLPIEIRPRSHARSVAILHEEKGACHACRRSRHPCRPPACCVRSGAGCPPVRVAGPPPARCRVHRPYKAAVAATPFLRNASYARPMGGTVFWSHLAHTSLPDAVGAGGQNHSPQGRPVGPTHALRRNTSG